MHTATRISRRRLRRWELALLAGVLTAFLGVPASAAALNWSAPVPVAAGAPVAQYGMIGGVSCPSPSLCVATDNLGNVLSTASPATGEWASASLVAGGVIPKPPGIERTWLFGISCPLARLCVALDERGEIVTSTDPAGGAGAWKAVGLPRFNGYVGQVSCPSTHLCVVVDGTYAATSNNPAGGPGNWTVARIARPGRGPSAVSCPSRHLCVGVSVGGDGLWVSRHPTRGRRGWRGWPVEHPRAPIDGLTAVSCPSTRQCYAVDGVGRVFSSRHPARGRRTWSSRRAGISPTALACPSAHLCVASGQGGVEVSTRPGGGRRAWRWVRAGSNGFGFAAVSCASTQLCVAVGDHGEVLASTDPTGGSAAWSLTAPDGDNSLSAVSCPTSSQCVSVGDASALDGQGTDIPGLDVVAASNNPTGGAGAWSVSRAVGAYSLSCPSTLLCVAGDGAGNVLTAGGPDGTWTRAAVVGPEQQCEYEQCRDTYASIHAMACPTASLCVGSAENAITAATYLLSSTDPAGGTSAWTVDRNPGFAPHAISCPSATFCAGVAGAVVGTTHTPTTGSSWQAAPVDSAANSVLTGLSCPSEGLCLATDNQGNVLASAAPGSPASWSTAQLDPGHALNGVACASAKLCVAFDDHGTAFTSTDPTDPSSWSATTVDSGVDVYGMPLQINAGACPSEQLCVLADSGGNVITGHP